MKNRLITLLTMGHTLDRVKDRTGAYSLRNVNKLPKLRPVARARRRPGLPPARPRPPPSLCCWRRQKRRRRRGLRSRSSRRIGQIGQIGQIGRIKQPGLIRLRRPKSVFSNPQN